MLAAACNHGSRHGDRWNTTNETMKTQCCVICVQPIIIQYNITQFLNSIVCNFNSMGSCWCLSPAPGRAARHRYGISEEPNYLPDGLRGRRGHRGSIPDAQGRIFEIVQRRRVDMDDVLHPCHGRRLLLDWDARHELCRLFLDFKLSDFSDPQSGHDALVCNRNETRRVSSWLRCDIVRSYSGTTTNRFWPQECAVFQGLKQEIPIGAPK